MFCFHREQPWMYLYYTYYDENKWANSLLSETKKKFYEKSLLATGCIFTFLFIQTVLQNYNNLTCVCSSLLWSVFMLRLSAALSFATQPAINACTFAYWRSRWSISSLRRQNFSAPWWSGEMLLVLEGVSIHQRKPVFPCPLATALEDRQKF